MSTKLWVKFENNHPTQVPTDGCSNVDDLLAAFFPSAGPSYIGQYTLCSYTAGVETCYNSWDALAEFGEHGRTGTSPLIIRGNTIAQGTQNITPDVTVSGTLQESRNEALQQYRNIANALKHDDTVEDVCKTLKTITSGEFPEDGFVDRPFVFLEGSSGSGKSQMGFAIQDNIRDDQDRLVFYFLFESPKEASQPIYLNFRNISKLFSQCCNDDMQRNSAEVSSPHCSSLFPRRLHVYGFIYILLSNGIDKSGVTIVPKTGECVRRLMIDEGIDKRRPVFILDECINSADDNSLVKVRFVRNCFRSLGLGLVMLGTDSKAAKLPADIGNSSRNGPIIPWCYVFGRFPAVKLSLLIGLTSTLPSWLESILLHSRPLFGQLVAEKYHPAIFDFDVLMNHVFQELVSIKRIFGNDYGRLGQLRLFQNAHYSLTDFDKQSTPLIHSHFAQLDGTKKNFVLMNDGCIENEHDFWAPGSVFPKLQDDILLYLILMGGKHYSAFYAKNGTPLPYAWFLREANLNSIFTSGILDFSSDLQKSEDGMFLESLLCSTVCLASHFNGIQGIGLKQFLLNLVYQLQTEGLRIDQVSIGGLDVLDVIPFTVPFLSPPNQSWPDFVEIPGSNFGSLKRTLNSEQIDLWACAGPDGHSNEYGLAGEAKDYDSPINIGTMKKILNRVPENAKVELIFTRKLQQSYFNTPAESFENQLKETHLMKRAFYKIDSSKPATSLVQIAGLPCAVNPEGVVIFFEINSQITSRPSKKNSEKWN